MLTGRRRWTTGGSLHPPGLGATVLAVIGVSALYAAANVYSLESRRLEHLARLAPSGQA